MVVGYFIKIGTLYLCKKYSALWVMQSTTGLRSMDYINRSGLIRGSEVFWLILQSQIVTRLDYTGFNPVMLCYMV